MVLDASKPKLCPRSEKKVTFWKASIFKMTTSWHWTKLSVSHQFSPEQRFTRSSTFLRASKLYNQVKSPLKLYPFSFAAHIAAYGSNWGITCIEHSHWSPQSPGPALRVSGRPSWHQPLLHTDIDKHAFTAARCTRPCANGAPPGLQAVRMRTDIQLFYVSNRRYHRADGRVNHRHITDTVSLTHFSEGIRLSPNLAQTALLC